MEKMVFTLTEQMKDAIQLLQRTVTVKKGSGGVYPEGVLFYKDNLAAISPDLSITYKLTSDETGFVPQHFEKKVIVPIKGLQLIMDSAENSEITLSVENNILSVKKNSKRGVAQIALTTDEFPEIPNWNLRYDRNNQTYRMLVSICYLVLKGLLQTQSDGTTKLMDFLDEQRMHRLYEKFVLEYYRKEHPELTVGAPQIPWQLDDDYSDMLPVMRSDIVLEKDDSILIIDAKYYAHTTQQRFNKATVHSANLYQIFTYVKNKQEELKDRQVTVSGMLLYAKTDEQIVPDNTYQMSGNQISVKTLDLNCGFDEIREQLDNITTSL